MANKPKICNNCGILLKKGQITAEGMLFCCQMCCDKKKASEKKVCEFC